MNKIFMILMASFLALLCQAQVPSFVTFSTKGPDCYADGTVVKDGEFYALVWSATGFEFAGFKADGTLVDSENNKVVYAVPLAKNGSCPTTAFILKDKNTLLVGKGTFSIYLLDTRLANGDKKMSVNVSDIGLVVSGYSKAADLDESSSLITHGAIGANAGVPSEIPENTPSPRVTAIRVANQQVIVSVADTVPYLQYTLTSGPTIENMTQNNQADVFSGSNDGEIEFVLDKTEDRFFKVIRKID